jgi:hypothetical protein
MNSFIKTPSIGSLMLSVGLLLLTNPDRAKAAQPQRFPNPDAAIAALDQAVATTNRSALDALFGDAAEQLVNPDEVQGAAELAAFAAALRESHRLIPNSDLRMTLEVGSNGWPFPIPLVKSDSGWNFDAQAGVEELLNRRIGRNELDVLRVMRAFVQAQREYAQRDRDDDQVLEYAQRLSSSPGQTDGLFWPPELNGEISPLGPFVAYAQAEGYSRKSLDSPPGPQPFHGYLFKILTRQGHHAPGGKYDYLINGNMIGGFALLAWPAEYGESGIMTFIVNQQGRVYQRDLETGTERAARKLRAYDPDLNWRLSPD